VDKILNDLNSDQDAYSKKVAQIGLSSIEWNECAQKEKNTKNSLTKQIKTPFVLEQIPSENREMPNIYTTVSKQLDEQDASAALSLAYNQFRKDKINLKGEADENIDRLRQMLYNNVGSRIAQIDGQIESLKSFADNLGINIP